MAMLEALAETLGYPDVTSMIEAEFSMAEDTMPGRRLEIHNAGDRIIANYTIRIGATLYLELQKFVAALEGTTPAEMTTRLRTALASQPGNHDCAITSSNNMINDCQAIDMINVIEMIQPTVVIISADGTETVSHARSSEWSSALACALVATMSIANIL